MIRSNAKQSLVLISANGMSQGLNVRLQSFAPSIYKTCCFVRLLTNRVRKLGQALGINGVFWSSSGVKDTTLMVLRLNAFYLGVELLLFTGDNLISLRGRPRFRLTGVVLTLLAVLVKFERALFHI